MSDADLAALPKAHLHLHLTGGMRHATLVELAEQYGVRLPERLVDEAPDDWRLLGWPRFQRLYDLARGVLRTQGDVKRLIRGSATWSPRWRCSATPPPKRRRRPASGSG
jgi:adenosine deaminase